MRFDGSNFIKHKPLISEEYTKVMIIILKHIHFLRKRKSESTLGSAIPGHVTIGYVIIVLLLYYQNP